MVKQPLPDLFSIMAPTPRAGPDAPRSTTIMNDATHAATNDASDKAATRAAANPAPNDSPEPVGVISARLKSAIEQQFDHVRVVGEISSFKQAPSGHGYFNLKDPDEKEKSVLNCFLLKHKFSYLPFKPVEGMMVVATGKISTYAARSNYQLFIDRLELAGTGNLLQILAERKQKLLAEGLFDAARKKPLPPFPKTIGVITSPTGAVIRDIIHRVTARFPCHVLLYPVLVQGEGAPADVCRAIAAMNQLSAGDEQFPRPDVLIIARGGGALEDLWTFNEEAVVRAVAASTIPTISAIGHETDTTLIDFAADMRAPTPTAAAEIALPFLLTDVLQQLSDSQAQIARVSQRMINQFEKNLAHWRARILSPANIIAQKTTALNVATNDLRQWQKYFFAERGEKMATLGRLLESLSYKKTLQRGYSIARQQGEIVSRKSAIAPHQSVALEFADGEINLPPATSKSE
ncbi:MAG: exodeoxyribonuclease VII large subunit [Hydrotalea sp.]|nr:exodeoxyribonuclease VII large subunit [Hydrotalea sp.]